MIEGLLMILAIGVGMLITGTFAIFMQAWLEILRMKMRFKKDLREELSAQIKSEPSKIPTTDADASRAALQSIKQRCQQHADRMGVHIDEVKIVSKRVV